MQIIKLQCKVLRVVKMKTYQIEEYLVYHISKSVADNNK